VISDKDSESAISSDGEFIDAGKINIFDEEDSYINQIENQLEKQALRCSIYSGPDLKYAKFAPLKTFMS
jgi:hypothetical protein